MPRSYSIQNVAEWVSFRRTAKVGYPVASGLLTDRKRTFWTPDVRR
jgi:hypothetical protein